MCTAATYLTRDFYFGRTLDYEFSYGEEVVALPRNYPFLFRQVSLTAPHYAFLGIAHVADGVPLYYDGINERGLGMAGLNFVGNAVYHEPVAGKQRVHGMVEHHAQGAHVGAFARRSVGRHELEVFRREEGEIQIFRFIVYAGHYGTERYFVAEAAVNVEGCVAAGYSYIAAEICAVD